MFARVKKTGQYQYLQLVQNRREGKKTIQRVVATLGSSSVGSVCFFWLSGL